MHGSGAVATGPTVGTAMNEMVGRVLAVENRMDGFVKGIEQMVQTIDKNSQKPNQRSHVQFNQLGQGYQEAVVGSATRFSGEIQQTQDNIHQEGDGIKIDMSAMNGNTTKEAQFMASGMLLMEES